MKKNLMKSALMLMAMTAVAFTSCTKDEPGIDSNEPVAVRFSSAISALDVATKAAGTTWAAGDNVGIFMVNTGATTIAENAENRQYTTTGSNSFAAAADGEKIFYPVDGSRVDFIAYYPHNVGQTLGTTYAVDLTNQSSQPDIDLLYSNTAVNKNKTTTNVTLTFDHKLTKIILNTTAGDGLTASDLSAMTISLSGMNTVATFNLATGKLSAGSAPAVITPLVVTAGTKYEAIVLPETVAQNYLIMEFALNNAKSEVFKRVNATASEVFEAGKVYTYNVNVKRTGVTLTCDITEWETTPVRNVEAD